MAKPFTFVEFENKTATVETPTQATDDMMGVTNTWASKTTVGASGIVYGSLQSLGGSRQQDLQGRFAAVVDYVFFPANDTVSILLVANGDRLIVSSTKYDVVHVEDETGAALAPVIYLKRID